MLKLGWGSRNIVPDRPAMVLGQKHIRIGSKAMDPLLVTAMALQGDTDCAILISCDLCVISEALQNGVRERLAGKLPGVPAEKIFMAATHTHASLTLHDYFYPWPGGDVMTPKECELFVAERAAQAAFEAWQALTPVQSAWAYGHAVVAHNRRPVYADGSAQMYGQSCRKDFRWIEGPEDHSLDMLFFWDSTGRLAGLLLDIPCPSQVDEGISLWSADYWHEIRAEVKSRLGEGVWVLPLCGVGGDVSPHFIFDGKQEEEMRKRRGISERQEIATRVVDEVVRALACTKPGTGDTVLTHKVKNIHLTPRGISKTERDWAQEERERSIKEVDPKLWWPENLRRVVETFDGKVKENPIPAEIHVLRIGDAVLATNPFELYVDFGLELKARSPAPQTLLSQLTSGTGWYLPTQRGVDGGGYGSMPAVSRVGPEGGQELIEETLKLIGEVYP